MGYELPKRTAILEFEEGDDYYGAEIEVSLDLPLEMIFRFRRARRPDSEHPATPEEVADEEQLYREFGDRALVRWNLTAGGVPVPATGAGFIAQPGPFCAAVMTAWTRATTGDSAPLVAPSDVGPVSQEPSGPMASPSPSPVN